MELQRILAKDTRSAMEQIHNLFGSDALVVSNKNTRGKTEVIVAIDVAANAKDMLDDLHVAAQDSPLPLEVEHNDFHHVMESKVLNRPPSSLASSGKNAAMTEGSGESVALTTEKVHHRDNDYLKTRELVDLVKLEFNAMRRELNMSQQIESDLNLSDMTSELRDFNNALKASGMSAPLRFLVNDIIDKHDDVTTAIEMISSAFGNTIPHQNVLDDMDGIHVIAGRLGVENSIMSMRIARQKMSTHPDNQVAVIHYANKGSDNWHQIQVLGLHSGVETHRAGTTAMLGQLLEELSDYSLVLIDTGGIALEHNLQEINQLVPSAKNHLLLAADASETSANRYLTNKGIEWDSVMLTQFEPDVYPWAVVSALMASNVPLSTASSSGSVSQHATTVDGYTLTKQSLLNLPASSI